MLPEGDEVEKAGDSSRRQRTQSRLIDAAYEVFAEQGVHAAAIETIVERAGFTRGAFYSNFESKEELFFALAERENLASISQIERAVAELRADGIRVPDETSLASLIENFLAVRADDRRWCLVQNEFRLLAMRDPAVATRYLEYQRNLEQRLSEVIDGAVGSVGLRFTIDVVLVTRLIMGVYESAAQEAILGDLATETAVRDIAMRTLPSLIHHLTRPL